MSPSLQNLHFSIKSVDKNEAADVNLVAVAKDVATDQNVATDLNLTTDQDAEDRNRAAGSDTL